MIGGLGRAWSRLSGVAVARSSRGSIGAGSCSDLLATRAGGVALRPLAPLLPDTCNCSYCDSSSNTAWTVLSLPGIPRHCPDCFFPDNFKTVDTVLKLHKYLETCLQLERDRSRQWCTPRPHPPLSCLSWKSPSICFHWSWSCLGRCSDRTWETHK